MDESASRMLLLRPSRGRGSNATLLRNHHENDPRSCILMTSASLNRCETSVKRKNAPKMGPKPPRNARFQKQAYEEILEPSMPSSQKRKNRSGIITKRAIPTHVATRACTYVLGIPRLRHPTMMLQNRSKTIAKRAKGTKTPDASRRAHQIISQILAQYW